MREHADERSSSSTLFALGRGSCDTCVKTSHEEPCSADESAVFTFDQDLFHLGISRSTTWDGNNTKKRCLRWESQVAFLFSAWQRYMRRQLLGPQVANYQVTQPLASAQAQKECAIRAVHLRRKKKSRVILRACWQHLSLPRLLIYGWRNFKRSAAANEKSFASPFDMTTTIVVIGRRSQKEICSFGRVSLYFFMAHQAGRERDLIIITWAMLGPRRQTVDCSLSAFRAHHPLARSKCFNRLLLLTRSKQ